MKLKTRQQLIDEGFKYITSNQNDMEIWAKFTGSDDCIQYVIFKEGEYNGDIQTITFGNLVLFEKMYKVMLNDFFKVVDINKSGMVKWV
jgi:hypothetical protein